MLLWAVNFAETSICDVTWRSSRDGLVISMFIFSILICLIASILTMIVVTMRALQPTKYEEVEEKKV